MQWRCAATGVKNFASSGYAAAITRRDGRGRVPLLRGTFTGWDAGFSRGVAALARLRRCALLPSPLSGWPSARSPLAEPAGGHALLADEKFSTPTRPLLFITYPICTGGVAGMVTCISRFAFVLVYCIPAA